MPARFLDANLLLRYFTRDDEDKAERVLALLQRVERGEEKLVTSSMVIFETIFTLQRYYRVPRDRIRELMEDLISLRGLQLSNKVLYYRSLELYANNNISFADAFNAAYVLSLHLSEVYSYDTDFDHLPGLQRMEPE